MGPGCREIAGARAAPWRLAAATRRWQKAGRRVESPVSRASLIENYISALPFAAVAIVAARCGPVDAAPDAVAARLISAAKAMGAPFEAKTGAWDEIQRTTALPDGFSGKPDPERAPSRC